MFTTYWEACEAEVTRSEAKAEIAKHQVEGGWDLFVREVGDKETYSGQEVLDWLGY